jgi:hypothetical protein
LSCTNLNISGVKKLLIADHQPLTPFYLNNSFHRIHNIPQNLAWNSFSVESEDVNLTESLNRTQAGNTYTQNISLKYLHISATKLKELQLLTKKRLLVIVQDYNNVCWVAGIDKGLKIQSFESSTGVLNGENRYDLSFEGTNRIRFQEIDLSYTSQFLSGSTLISNCDYSIAGVAELWIGNYPQDLQFYLNNDNSNIIERIEGVDLLFNKFDVSDQSELSESLSLTQEGPVFNHKFAFEILNLSTIRREQITNIIKLKNLLVVVKDFNNHWWIAGLDRSLRVRSYNASTESGSYNLEFSGVSKYQMKEITSQHIEEVLSNTYTVSSLYDAFNMGDFATNNISIATIADAQVNDFE